MENESLEGEEHFAPFNLKIGSQLGMEAKKNFSEKKSSMADQFLVVFRAFSLCVLVLLVSTNL